MALSEVVGRVLDPAITRRGFATADLIAAWSEVIGPAYADCTAPEKIAWPRGAEKDGTPGTLTLRVDGPKAIYIQHEIGEIVDRINGFFGYQAVGRIKLVQGPVAVRRPPVAAEPPPLDAEAERAVGAAVEGIESAELRAALSRLGRDIRRGSNKPS